MSRLRTELTFAFFALILVLTAAFAVAPAIRYFVLVLFARLVTH